MKLIRAKFHNFRLLRDLDISFSTDSTRKLTVVRAENETGKTTILTALQWAFYGDEALPGNGKTYRIHPIDCHESRVDVSVEIDFETTVAGRAGRKPAPARYRLIRSATDAISGHTFERMSSELRLYELTAAGAQKLDHPQNHVRTAIPIELREVFFTDGDRALSFIEADSTSIKRRRVEDAIKSLLGLSIVEDASKHVKQASADVNRKVKESDAGRIATEASNRIERLDEQISVHEELLAQSMDSKARCEEQHELLNKRIEAALEKGDRAALLSELGLVRSQLKREQSLELSSTKELGEIMRSKSLGRALLSKSVKKAAALLEELREKGRIPSQTIPVLVERLSQETCICGELLDDSLHGIPRRRHIEHLIEASRSDDAVQKIITQLYYGATELITPSDGQDWAGTYAALCDRRAIIGINIEDLTARDAQVEARISVIPDVDLQAMREQRRVARSQADNHGDQATRATLTIEGAKTSRAAAQTERDEALKQEGKAGQLRAELTVAQDILRVFDQALGRLKSEELSRVSSLMNDIFLEMIGADAEQGAIIQRACISQDFDIVVYGPGRRVLDPDRDLNGASRRALTLAFILSLTEVSGVVAPNIIDTPLGMMSGFVKSSVLHAAIMHSAQLILFLTRSEIQGTEELLDQYAGQVITLTNPAHYPKMLLHKPASTSIQVVSCGCSYAQSCNSCARRMHRVDELQSVTETAG